MQCAYSLYSRALDKGRMNSRALIPFFFWLLWATACPNSLSDQLRIESSVTRFGDLLPFWRFFKVFGGFFSWQNCQRFWRLFYLKNLLIFNLKRLVKYELLCIYFLLFEGRWCRSFEFSNLLWYRAIGLLNLWRLFWNLFASFGNFFCKPSGH
jgi:hypothetical protein